MYSHQKTAENLLGELANKYNNASLNGKNIVTEVTILLEKNKGSEVANYLLSTNLIQFGREGEAEFREFVNSYLNA